MKTTTHLMKTHWINPIGRVSIFSLLILLTACSTSKEKIFKEDMPTMKEVYIKKFNHIGANKKAVIKRELLHKAKPDTTTKQSMALDHPIISSYAELIKQFPKAPNPTMLMYIFPHLTHSGTPVPGYNTYFNLYEIDHFTISTSNK